MTSTTRRSKAHLTGNNRGLAVGALLAAALSYGVVAQATVIFQTDFEAPGYTTGALAGQNGWQVFGASGAVSIDGSAPIAGLQSARIDGSQVLGQSGPFHTDASAIARITVSADILLRSGQAERSWQFAALGAGLVGFSGGIDIDSTTNGFATIGNFSRDAVHHVDLLLDYSTQLFGVKLDGVTLASGLAFCGDNGPCAGAPTGAYSNLLFDTFGASGDDFGYIDNILVESTRDVPEPGSLALLCGALIAAPTLRRKRS
jgi:hypothetical protein